VGEKEKRRKKKIWVLKGISVRRCTSERERKRGERKNDKIRK
jgi:hypothetical protein